MSPLNVKACQPGTIEVPVHHDICCDHGSVGVKRFLGVDYMRRLVMDTAQQKGFRLMMEPRVLEQTGRCI